MSAVTPLPLSPLAPDSAALQRTFDAQRETALRLRGSSHGERRQKIRRLRDALLSHRQDLYRAGEADFRKPPAEIDLTELLPVVAEANDALRHLRRWMRPRHVWPTRAMLGTSGYVQRQARGRCLIISPWNYPVNLSFGPLVSALAAGNTAILKPSEMTPHLSELMVRIVRELFAPEEVAIVEGDARTATALLELPFDHIFFTGSPAVGKVVMAAAAKHLTSVTLELGGRSPTIIDASADLSMAARNLMWSKFTNDGQTCIAPDHVFVHASVKDRFIEHCRKALSHAYGDNPAAWASSPYLARVVNQRHTQRIRALLDDATSRGAVALTGGVVDEHACYIAPTLLDRIPDDARILQEEIFGPLLPILPFDSIDEVIERVNRDPKPLALYVWSRTEENIRRVMQGTSSGGACINHSVVQFLHGNLPFGGINNSGLGSSHGEAGFLAFSHERAVVRSRVSLATMFFPPYTPTMRRIVDLLIKIV